MNNQKIIEKFGIKIISDKMDFLVPVNNVKIFLESINENSKHLFFEIFYKKINFIEYINNEINVNFKCKLDELDELDLKYLKLEILKLKENFKC